jgi:uncharacterized protein (TIGR02266 family)
MLTNLAEDPNAEPLLEVPPANDVERRAPSLRSTSRFALSAAVSLESEHNLYAGLSYDVSAGGIFVATVDTPPIGARVDVTVALPDGRELMLVGVVRWVRDAALATDGLPPGCGIQWKWLSLEALHALAEFAEAREPLLWLTEAA